MSASDANTPRGTATLVAYGEPGVEIKVVDTDYRVVGTGTDELKLSLAEGIYMVDWTSGGQVSQKLVRLLPIEEPLVVRPDPTPGPMEALAAGSATGESGVAKVVEELSRPSERDYGSEIAVIIRADSLGQKLDLSAGLRLLDHDDRSMRSDGLAAAALQDQMQDGYACRLYHVRPGLYRLRYEALTGETLDQTMPALRDRRTVVFMSAGSGQVLEAAGDSFQTVRRDGIDPSRTVVASVSREAPSGELAEAARLAEILLHDLGAGRSSLGQALATALDRPEADPLLRLYAAAMVLARIDLGASPALDEAWPEAPEDQAAFAARWRGRAAEWLRGALPGGALPDATAMIWRLQAVGQGDDLRAPALTSPPMLECAWSWTVARSTQDPKAVPADVGFRAAGRGGGGTAPWLTWRAAQAKGDLVAGQPAKPGGLEAGIDAVAAKLREVTDAGPAANPSDRAADPLDLLSPDTKAVALRAAELVNAEPQPASAETLDRGAQLATLFGAPAVELQALLSHALSELDGVSDDAPTAESPNIRTDPPGLSLPVTDPDDPNHGRFGGRPERDGYRLSATFSQTRNRNWIRIELKIAGPDGRLDGERAEFFLHDSFKPARVGAVFRDGVASRAVTAWGGFTAGAWIPRDGVELELDLATIADAPKVIRER